MSSTVSLSVYWSCVGGLSVPPWPRMSQPMTRYWRHASNWGFHIWSDAAYACVSRMGSP